MTSTPRRIGLLLALLLTGLLGLPAVPATAGSSGASGDLTPEAVKSAPRDATLERVAAYLAGTRELRPSARPVRARHTRARPSDPPSGTSHFSWDPAAPRARSCAASVCVHYVTTTTDAPPMTSSDGVTPDWVRRTLEVSEQALTAMSGLGYPGPPSDQGRGGTAQFDIYLADISQAGLYGFCAPETPVPGNAGQASSYCVLDNDFTGFPMPPDESLRVTAAHELFHAVQFGMDVREDHWFLESTATWMEEQIADDVDDNRQFLSEGQLGSRLTSLDDSQAGLASYGNWIFFQFLSQRYGTAAVRRIWELADASPGNTNHHSVAAIRRYVESRRGRFPRVYADFAAANLAPGRFYDEGRAYRPAKPDHSVRLGARRRAWRGRAFGVPHLAARAVAVKPARGLRGRHRLRVHVDARRRVDPAATVVVVLRSGRVKRAKMRLDKRGRGSRVVRFDRRGVRRVVVVVANASTRSRCGRSTHFACRGIPRDDAQRFDVRVTLARPKR